MDIIEAIEKRRSIRRYKDKLVPEETVNRILNAARMAPSANNHQPYFFLIIQDPVKKRGLLQACRKSSEWIEQAPILIVAIASMEEAYPSLGGYLNSYAVDTAIAIDHLTLAATNEGLGTCWICAFHEEKAKEFLGIGGNSDLKIVAMLPLGYPAEEPNPTPRKQLLDIVQYEEIEL